MTSIRPAVPAASIRPIGHREWTQLGRAQSAAFLTLLEDLDQDDWQRPTECDGWAVADIAAHVLGWAIALSSPVAYLRQTVEGRRRRARYGNNPLHAVNDFQVRTHSSLAPKELLDRLERRFAPMNALRAAAAMPLKVVPYREGFTGSWVSVGFALDVIVTRDHFMHRLDVERAIGRPHVLDEPDTRLVYDLVREWARRSGAQVMVELQDAPDGRFLVGSGEAGSIRTTAVDLARLFAGRTPSMLAIEGDRRRIEEWLQVRCIF